MKIPHTMIWYIWLFESWSVMIFDPNEDVLLMRFAICWRSMLKCISPAEQLIFLDVLCNDECAQMKVFFISGTKRMNVFEFHLNCMRKEIRLKKTFQNFYYHFIYLRTFGEKKKRSHSHPVFIAIADTSHFSYFLQLIQLLLLLLSLHALDRR